MASKHVRLRFQIFRSVDGPCGRAVNLVLDHYDLCEMHVDDARLHFEDVIEFELTDCRECTGSSN